MFLLYRRFFVFLLLCVSWMVVYGGCTPQKRSRDVAHQEEAPLIEKNRLTHSVEGRKIEYIRFGSGEKTSLIVGAIHGDEPASKILARKLSTNFRQSPNLFEGHQIIVVPVINPDGLAAGTRGNANEVDLNRNFPTSNRKNTPEFGMEGFSEPESRALGMLQNRYQPELIISIHQPLACIDYDGPGREIAEAMSEYCNLPVRKLGAMPGSYGSYAGLELNIPIITFEMRKGDENKSPERIWKKYGKAVMAGLYYPREPVVD